MKILKYLLLLLLCLSLLNCKQPPKQVQIYTTAHNVLNAIKENDEQEFVSLIGIDLSSIGKDKEILNLDFKQIRTNYFQYIGNNEPEINITKKHDGIGRLIIEIPFYTKKDSTDSHDNVKLVLLFGPRAFVPLNKISGYHLVLQDRFNYY